MFLNSSLDNNFDLIPEEMKSTIRSIDSINNQTIRIENGSNSNGNFMFFRITATRFAMNRIKEMLNKANQKFVIGTLLLYYNAALMSN